MEFRRTFIATYRRTTEAVGRAIEHGSFNDPRWVPNWDNAFADLFFVAHDADLAGERPPRPWRLAFDPSERLNPLQHLLLGMNAHINFDLPQALLAVITDDDFTDPVLIGRRRRDHERINQILASRVSAEDGQLAGSGAYRARLAGRELLSAAKSADLTAPGQVLLRLAAGGFGVVLPPPDL